MPDTVAPVEAFYHEITSEPCSSQLSGAVSPVIQVKPSEIEDGSINDGRIYFNMDTHDVLNDKGDKAYAKCARYFRKWPKTQQLNFRVGPKTAKEVRESTLRLMHWGREMEILE